MVRPGRARSRRMPAAKIVASSQRGSSLEGGRTVGINLGMGEAIVGVLLSLTFRTVGKTNDEIGPNRLDFSQEAALGSSYRSWNPGKYAAPAIWYGESGAVQSEVHYISSAEMRFLNPRLVGLPLVQLTIA